MQGAVESLKKWTLPQAVNSPVIQPTAVKQTFLPPKPTPVDPNKTAEVFKKKFIEKHGDWVAEDGRKYSQIPANEIVAKVIRKYGDGVTTDGTPYRDYLPRPASPNDSLEYRLKQIESLSTAPKSEFSTNGIIRWQTEEEKKFTSKAPMFWPDEDWLSERNKMFESELETTLKSPLRGVHNFKNSIKQGIRWLAADVSDYTVWGEWWDKTRKDIEMERFRNDPNSTKLWFLDAISRWDWNQAIEALAEWGSSMILSGVWWLVAKSVQPIIRWITWLTQAASQWGNLSLEWEQQWQNSFWDKVTAYTTALVSAYLDRASSENVISWLTRAWVKKQVATNFVWRMNNYLKGLKPSDFEAGTEIIQQKIENIGRDIMGVKHEEWLKQYLEAGLMGKLLGKIGDKGRSEAPVTVFPPAPPAPPKTPKYVNNNLWVIQWIRTGVKWNEIVTNAKSRGFDPETDVATYKELKPDIDKDGKVNTDDAQINLKKHVDPMQNTVTELIKAEQKTVPIETAYQVMKQMIDEDLWSGLNYEAAINRLEVARRTLERNAKNWQVDLAALDEMKKTIYSETDYTKDNDKADKAIARGLKEVIEQNVSNAKIKELNNELARWYTTRQYLRLLWTGTKTVKGGRLGGYGASLTGTIIGSMIGSMGWPITGAIWGFVGREVSSKIHGNMLKNVLSDSETKLPQSKKFQEANMALQNKKVNMALPPPSGLPLSGSVVDANVRTGYAPGVMQSMNIENTSDRVSPVLPQTTLLPSKKTPQKLLPVNKTTKQASVEWKESKTWESIKSPTIPKSQPKAKLRTNEDALKKPKTPQERKTAIDEAKKYDTSEKFVIKNKQSDYDNSTFLEPYIWKQIEFTIWNWQRVNWVIYRNTNGDIVWIPNEKFTLRHNWKTIESNFDDFEVPLNSNFKLNGHSVRMKDWWFLGDEISKDIYKQSKPKPSPLSQKSEVKYSEALSKVDKKNLDVENMSGIWETLPTNYAGKKIDIQKDLTDIDWLETKLLEKNITWVSSGALSKFVEPHPYFKSSYKIADIDGKWYLFLKKWVDFNSLPKQAKFDITTALNKEFYITNDWWKTWKSYSYK